MGACSASLDDCNCLSLTSVCPQIQRKREKEIDAQKALNSCLISSFTVSIIKSGFNWLSNPNLSIQLEVAFSKSSVLKSGDTVSLRSVVASSL